MKRIIIIAISLACWLTPAKAQMAGGAEKRFATLKRNGFTPWRRLTWKRLIESFRMT